MGGVVAGHDGQSFGPPVGEVLVHGPVGVDIEEAGDQILSPGVQVTGTLGGAHSGDDAVFEGEGALLEGAVQEQPQPMSPDHSSSMASGFTSTGMKASSLSQPVMLPFSST